MRAVIQRVSSASVEVDGAAVGTIERGVLVYVAGAAGDTTDSAECVAAYAYDGLSRRITKKVDNQGIGIVHGSDAGGATGIQAGDRGEHYYYAGWRAIELRDNSGNTLGQFVYGMQYIDEAVVYDRDTDDDDDCVDSSGSQRYVYHQDANYRVLALTRQDGTVVERYEYTAYGEPAVLRGVPSGGSSENGAVTYASTVGNPLMHQGLWRDGESKSYQNRYRVLNSVVGRFLQRDPLGYVSSSNLYLFALSGPLMLMDPLGLKEVCGPTVAALTGSWCAEEEVYDAARDAFDESVWDRTQGTMDGVASSLSVGITDALGVNAGDALGDHTFDPDNRENAAGVAGLTVDVASILIGLAPGKLVVCLFSFPGDTLVHTPFGLERIDAVEPGDVIISWDDSGEREHESFSSTVDPATWIALTLAVQNVTNGDRLNMRTLRPLSQFGGVAPLPGDQFWVHFSLTDDAGLATVIEVSACPPIHHGRGRVVLSTFSHITEELVELQLASAHCGSEPRSTASSPIVLWTLASTPNHQLFVPEKGVWVHARDLTCGDVIQTRRGTARVLTINVIDTCIEVFDLEVEGAHEFLVGQYGGRAHNMCFSALGKRALAGLGLGGANLARKSFNAGRKILERAGFKWTKTTKTGRKVFEHPKTGATVSHDSGKALVPGQNPHWHIQDKGGKNYNRSGRQVGSDECSAHIPGRP